MIKPGGYLNGSYPIKDQQNRYLLKYKQVTNEIRLAEATKSYVRKTEQIMQNESNYDLSQTHKGDSYDRKNSGQTESTPLHI